MVWLKSSHSSLCAVVSIFDILNGACLIFAVVGNVLEKCCFLSKNCLEWSQILLSTLCMTLVEISI